MPKPGPHSLSRSLPLSLIVRDVLEFAKTAKEAKKIISKGKIKVDGKTRCDERFLVGLMDVIDIPDINKSYRVLPSKKGLFLNPINSEDSAFKLFRIEDKTIVKGGNLHLNLHDGSNLMVDMNNSEGLDKETFHTLDVLKLSVPGRELLEYTKLRVGSTAVVIGGKNMGQVGKIASIEKKADKKRKDLLVTLKDVNGNQFQTILDFVFVLGANESLISFREND
jgi:small subunit ribosomal protein S4e